MRTKRTRMYDTRTKVHIFTGGIKENVAQIELRGGELIDCLNYQEVDGQYHGYSSIPGYEAFDGQLLPSEVPVIYRTDYGNDRYTVLLIEGDQIIDKSAKANPFINQNNVTYDTSFVNFWQTSLKFASDSFLVVGNQDYFDINGKEYTWNMMIRPSSITGNRWLMRKNGVWKLQLMAGKVTFSVSSDGNTYPHVIEMTGTVPLNAWTHIEVTKTASGDFKMYIDGQPEVATLTGVTCFTNVQPVRIGYMNTADPGYEGYIDELRLSEDSVRHVLPFELPEIPYSQEGFYTYQIDDVERETQRALIEPVPGVNNINGVHVMDGVVYAVRDAGVDNALMYKSTVSGWSPLSGTLNTGGTYRFTVGQFDELAGLQRQPVAFFASGVDYPAYIDGNTVEKITHVNLPDDGVSFFATHVIEFKNRLFLGYPDGRLLFSAVGNPTNFDPISGAGELYLEDTITNLIVAPGDALIIFGKNSTYVMKSLTDVNGASGEATAQYKFYMETFSKTSGAFPDTAQRILGTVITSGEKGVTSLEATDAFGDFSSAFVSKNVQVTYMKYKDLITTSTVQKVNNQYRLFMSDGQGLFFTFDAEKRVKGVTKIKYINPVILCSEGLDAEGNIMIVFSSTNGFVYKMDSGTSFNGEDIVTKLSTAYDSYGSPNSRKRFRGVTLEMKAGRDTTIFGALSFDYGSPAYPKFNQEDFIAESPGGVWGVDRWGQFTYGSSITQNPTLYANGYGKNMSLSIASSDRYRETHIVNAAIIKYTVVGDVM